MKITSANTQQVSLPEQINLLDVISKIYDDINPSFFMGKPSIYDDSYISVITREQSVFKIDRCTNKKTTIINYMQQVYSGCPVNFTAISRDDANTQEGSWLTVITGASNGTVFCG